MKKIYLYRSLVLFFIAIILLSINSCSEKEAKNFANKNPEEIVVPVLVKEAYLGTLDSFLDIDARVEYQKISNVSFQVSGKIENIFVQEGDRVKKGQLLLSLDKTLYNQQVEQAYQAMLAAKANYEQAVFNLKIQKVQVDSDLQKTQLALKQAEENLNLAQTLLYQAKKDFERFSKLYNEGVISSQQFENVKIQYQNSLTNYYNSKIAFQQARENLNVAKLKKERISIFENQTKAAYSNYLASQRNYNIVKENYRYTDLFSPMDGIVLKKLQDVGATVNPSVPVLTIGDPSTKIVKASIADTEAKNIKSNTRAFVVFKNKEYPVIISKIYPNVSSIGQTFIEGRFISDNNLNHNDYVNLKINIKSIRGIIILRQAIVYSEDGAYVFIVENNIAVKKKVKIVDSYGDLSIVEGISEGDKVIIDGQYFVKDGDKVKVSYKK